MQIENPFEGLEGADGGVDFDLLEHGIWSASDGLRLVTFAWPDLPQEVRQRIIKVAAANSAWMQTVMELRHLEEQEEADDRLRGPELGDEDDEDDEDEDDDPGEDDLEGTDKGGSRNRER